MTGKWIVWPVTLVNLLIVLIVGFWYYSVNPALTLDQKEENTKNCHWWLWSIDGYKRGSSRC